MGVGGTRGRVGLDPDPAAGWGGLQGVAEQVVEDLFQVPGGAGHNVGVGDVPGQCDVRGGGYWSPDQAALRGGRGEGNRPDGGRCVLGPGDGEQPVDHAGQPVHLDEGAGHLPGDRRVDVLLQQLQAQPHRGQRGADLVGDVGEEVPLTVDEGLVDCRF